MSDFIDRFGTELHEAAQRELRPRRFTRLATRPGRVIAVGFAALVAVGVPAAAESGWFPFAGQSDAPSTTHAAPASRLSSMLAVLRRAQTDADRGSDSTYALRFVGSGTFKNVEVDYVRRVISASGRTGVVLVPAEARRRLPNKPFEPDVVCVWQPDYSNGEPIGGGRGCYNAGDIGAGKALQSLGHRFVMLVPDGVSRVQATSSRGATDSATPTDNVASWDGGPPAKIVWSDENGKPIRTFTYAK
jgi:hypothetical protein